MDCTTGSKQKEIVVKGVVMYAQAMAERLYAEVVEKSPVLAEMEQAVLAELHSLGNEMLGVLAGMYTESYPVASVACPCGEQAQYQRQRSGQSKTLLGTIRLKRAYYLCHHCHQGSYPVDQHLGFCAGSISAGLDELLALLGCQFSFAESAQMVKRLTLVEVSPNRCRRSTQTLGRLVAADEEAARHFAWTQPELPLPPVSQETLDPLYISADGVTVHTRETGWREQCVGTVYTTKCSAHAKREIRSKAISYVTELGARAQFSQYLWLEAHRRGLQQAQTTVFIADGAQWLWETAYDLFPQAIQILDWYHATTYLWAVAHQLHPKDKQAAQQWIEPQLALLAHSQSERLLQQLQQLAAASPAAHSAFTYFTNNRTRIDYSRYRQLGLQIGSGTIESTCKHLIEARLKQAGMRWNLVNARFVAKLRARLKSQRWQETVALRPLPSRSYSRSVLH
jgi:hypothetical protein